MRVGTPVRCLVLILGFLFLLAQPSWAQQDEPDGCRFAEAIPARSIAGFVVRIEKVNPEDWSEGCRAVVQGPQGPVIVPIEDWDIRFNEASGKDLNGDGQPEIVFEGYSGGAHCCWTYWIVSLAKPAGLLHTLCNNRSGEFADLDKDGKFEFLTLDGAFDYFDEMSHAASPFPMVVLRLEGRKLKRVNTEFWSLYEKDIAEARKASPEALRLFRGGNREAFADQPHDWEATKQHILELVLANLYGGREEEAWKILGEYWPPADVRRIKAEILKTAKEGFLGDPNRRGFGCYQ